MSRINSVMRASNTLDQIFPIKDEPSAMLMGLKAERLYAAGIIGELEKRIVLEHADAFRASSLTQRPQSCP
jgi:hypothetical protein